MHYLGQGLSFVTMDTSNVDYVRQERVRVSYGYVTILQDETDILGRNEGMGCVLVQVPSLDTVHVEGGYLGATEMFIEMLEINYKINIQVSSTFRYSHITYSMDNFDH